MANTTLCRVSAALTFVVTAAGCSAIGLGEQAAPALPPPPPVVDRSDQPIAPPTDGLHRFVVTPPPPDAGGSDETGVEPGIEVVDGARDSRFAIDPELLAQVTEDATLFFRNGVPGIIDEDGNFLSLVAASPRSTGAGSADDAIEEAATDPMIQGLRALDNVVAAVSIGDGSYAVTATRPDALDGFGLDVTPDVPLALNADPYEPYQWMLDNTGTNLAGVQSPAPVQIVDADIDGREAATGGTGLDVVVAVIDTGVDFSHPDLAGQNWTNPGEICGNSIDDDQNGYVDDCTGWDFGYEDNVPWSPANGDHGTHVAGIIGAKAGNGQGISGIAPGARIMDLSVAGPGGMTTSSVARAIRYAVDNGADVINMSLGSTPGTPAQAVIPLIDAVIHADAHDVLVVVAAGNSSVNLTTAPSYPANIEAGNLIVVGASTAAETKAPFSNYGPVVDLFAPGDLIVSTIPGGGYVFMSGTSQASPAVAAVAATIIEGDPAAAPAAIRSQLVGTADEFEAYVGQAANGVRINAARALGIDPESAGESDSAGYVSISGLAAATTDRVEAKITIGDPGGQFNQPHHWEASMVAITADGVFGIVDHPITVDDRDAATDGRGAVVLTESDDAVVTLRTTLPAGSYGMVIEAIPETDSTVRLGDAFVATFDIGSPGSGDTDQTEGETGDGSGGTGDGSSTPTSASDSSQGATPTSGPNSGQVTTTTTAGGDGGGSTSGGTSGGNATASPSTTRGSGAGGAASTPTSRSGSGSGSQPSGGGSNPGESEGGSGTTGSGDGGTTTSRPSSGPTSTRRPTVTTPGGGSAATTVSNGGGGSSGNGGGAGPRPGTVTDGDWSIQRISPNSGPTRGSTLVSLIGKFPDPVYVWFGDQAGEVVYQSEEFILAATPARAAPGTVDVELRGNTRRLSLPNGFTYFDPALGDGPTGGTGSGANPGTGSSPGSGSTPGVDGETGPDVTIDNPTPSTIPSPSPGESPDPGDDRTNTDKKNDKGKDKGKNTGGPSTQRQARASILGDPVELGNGLRGAPLSGLETVGGLPRCSSDPCRTRRK